MLYSLKHDIQYVYVLNKIQPSEQISKSKGDFIYESDLDTAIKNFLS